VLASATVSASGGLGVVVEPPDLAAMLLKNDGRHRALLEADDFLVALRGSGTKATLEADDFTAAVRGSNHTAAVHEG
jgi:hypothetical protein